MVSLFDILKFFCSGNKVIEEITSLLFQSFCQRLLNITEEDIKRLRIKRNPKTKQPEIACFTHNMELFFEVTFD